MQGYSTFSKYNLNSINVSVNRTYFKFKTSVDLDFGSMADGLTWLLTIVYRLIKESYYLLSHQPKTNSGVLYWRKLMPSKQYNDLFKAPKTN